MRPVELSEPGSQNHKLKTEEFDVDSALSELEEMGSSQSENTDEADSDLEEQNSSKPSKEEDKTGFLSRLKSLF